MKVLITGAAGFIGYHVCERLLARGDTVIGLDNLDTSGDVTLKATRLSRLRASSRFGFHRTDIRDAKACRELFEGAMPERVVHLAARVGVRALASEAQDYTETNVTGFLQMLELCRQVKVEHLVFASSSSVYGGMPPPFTEDSCADRPLNLYAATKRSNELMAHAYSSQYGLPVTGLRLFTVYGPWGRTDMAPMLFLRALLEGRSLLLHGEGKMRRDFTYVDDAVEALVRALDTPPLERAPPYRLLNVGSGTSVEMAHFVDLLEEQVGTKAWVELRPRSPGEMEATCADITALERETGFRPQTSLEQGLARLVAWYRGQEG